MKNKLVPASGSSPDLGGLEPPVLGIIHHTEGAGLLTTDQEDVVFTPMTSHSQQ
jgi:hypothetical protein